MSQPKRPTISRDPYAFIGTPTTATQDRKTGDPAPAARTQAKEKITIPYPVDLIERARNAAYWDRTTLNGIMVQALADALDRMEKGRGEPYPQRTSPLRDGRPVGSGKRQ